MLLVITTESLLKLNTQKQNKRPFLTSCFYTLLKCKKQPLLRGPKQKNKQHGANAVRINKSKKFHKNYLKKLQKSIDI